MKEQMNMIISIFAIVISIISTIFSWRANSKANRLSGMANNLTEEANRISSEAVMKYNEANQIAKASILQSLRQQLTATRQHINTLANQSPPMPAKEERTPEQEEIIEKYIKVFNSAVEDNINAYEEACATYIDNKVDKERFKKIYYREIRQLVENEEYKEYFDAVKSPYKAILKVYDEWYNLEK